MMAGLIQRKNISLKIDLTVRLFAGQHQRRKKFRTTMQQRKLITVAVDDHPSALYRPV